MDTGNKNILIIYINHKGSRIIVPFFNGRANKEKRPFLTIFYLTSKFRHQPRVSGVRGGQGHLYTSEEGVGALVGGDFFYFKEYLLWII